MPPFHLPNKLTLWVNSITSSDILKVFLRRSDTYTDKRRRTMSVQDYALFEPIAYPDEKIKVLGVHDGWNTYARRFIFCFPNYIDTYGAFYG